MTADLPVGGLPPARDPVVRGAVIHLSNEQPVVADLFDFPTALDVAVVCTNMRTQDGKRPVFPAHDGGFWAMAGQTQGVMAVEQTSIPARRNVPIRAMLSAAWAAVGP